MPRPWRCPSAVLDWYKEANKKKRLGRIIDDIGLDKFKAELGLPAA